MFKKLFDRNSVWWGLLLSLISPVALYFIIKELVYWITLWTNPVLLQAYHQTLISDASCFLIGVVFNVLIFRTYLKRKEYEMTGRGVLVMTTFLTFVFVAWKMSLLSNLF